MAVNFICSYEFNIKAFIFHSSTTSLNLPICHFLSPRELLNFRVFFSLCLFLFSGVNRLFLNGLGPKQNFYLWSVRELEMWVEGK